MNVTVACPRCCGNGYIAGPTGSRNYTVCPGCHGRRTVTLPGGHASPLDDLVARLTEAERLLRALVADDLVGWTISERQPFRNPQWCCTFCGAKGPVEEGRDDPPAHAPTCPIRQAHDLLAR